MCRLQKVTGDLAELLRVGRVGLFICPAIEINVQGNTHKYVCRLKAIHIPKSMMSSPFLQVITYRKAEKMLILVLESF